MSDHPATSGAATGPARGRLLVALPALSDPNFDRTVVFVLEHTDDGAFGLVLNRPTEEPPAAALEAWEACLVQPAVVFSGGPVQPDAFIGLAAVTGEAREDSWALLGNGLATVDLSLPPDAVLADLDAVRIFHGYAGWGPSQLDDELAHDAWVVVDPLPGDVFTADPGVLWRTVLRRQPGRLSWLADYPDDISTN
ncbi:MAG: YqgE/AlgH family protein [Ilumatobacteraceae bacterium]